MVARPRANIHFETLTDNCTCDHLAGCGGIVSCSLDCPEHGLTAEVVHYHIHAMQVQKTSVGTMMLV